jgi:hypothetical protein
VLPRTDDISEPFPNPDPSLLGTAETLTAWLIPAALLRDGANETIVSVERGEPVDLAFLDLAMS